MSEFIREKLDQFPDYQKGISIDIGPVTGGNAFLATFTMGLTSEEIAKIRTGAAGLFYYGFIEYRDDFSLFGARKIGFCYRYNAEGNPNVSSFDTCKNPNYTYVR